MSDPKQIAELFCKYFSNFGPNLANKIPPTHISFWSCFMTNFVNLIFFDAVLSIHYIFQCQLSDSILLVSWQRQSLSNIFVLLLCTILWAFLSAEMFFFLIRWRASDLSLQTTYLLCANSTFVLSILEFIFMATFHKHCAFTIT